MKKIFFMNKNLIMVKVFILGILMVNLNIKFLKLFMKCSCIVLSAVRMAIQIAKLLVLLLPLVLLVFSKDGGTM
ncbi:hypothetical protein ACSBR2_010996 [Camellia fascicularis]